MNSVLHIWTNVTTLALMIYDTDKASLALQTATRQTELTLDTCRRISALLDTPNPADHIGQLVPKGWHFPLIGAETIRRDLRQDGFPGLGLPFLQSSLPRVVAGGRKVFFHSPVPVGIPLLRTSQVTSVDNKQTSSGTICIVEICHNIKIDGDDHILLEEHQTFLLLSARHTDPKREEVAPDATPLLSKTIVLDDTSLFQFSALSFNSHKIHLDRAYARDVEGFPDLVVNGGLTTLLMTEMLRNELGRSVKAIKVTNNQPLFVNSPVTFSAFETEVGVQIYAVNDRNRIAAVMEATTHEL